MRRVGVVVLVAGLLTACGDDGSGAACGPVTREQLDPNSGLHVLPDQDVPAFMTDPPTSGAHYSLPPPTGAVADSVEPAMQVTALEGGMVLVQYRDLPDDDVASLEELGSDQVLVAPNDDLPEPVVLTAWLTKQTCSGVDLDQINAEFERTDVALVIGANDVVNPAARHDKTSPIYGMPILDADKAKYVVLMKRSLNPGFAGIDNELYYDPKTMMLFGDAKKVLTRLVEELKTNA